MNNEQLIQEVEQALQGSTPAMEHVVEEVCDLIFDISLRMLGSVADAQDATQDIIIKIITNLATFKKESTFTTWLYRIAVNYLLDYRKSMFAQQPLNFEFYANDIEHAVYPEYSVLFDMKQRMKLEEELKLSCTNVMLQCFDVQTRCIYILGTMFHVNSMTAAEILDITPENYRKILSRAKKKMSSFLSKYCGLCNGSCTCAKRLDYAIEQHRIDPNEVTFLKLEVLDHTVLNEYREIMEQIDEKADLFETMPHYYATQEAKDFIKKLLISPQMNKLKEYER